jgi:hypothetical protein
MPSDIRRITIKIVGVSIMSFPRLREKRGWYEISSDHPPQQKSSAKFGVVTTTP